MRRVFLVLLLLASLLDARASKNRYLKNDVLKEYSIVYSKMVEPEEGADMAGFIRELILHEFGISLDVIDDESAPGKHEILVGRTSRGRSVELSGIVRDTFEYIVEVSEGNVVICGGGCWAMQYAAEKWLHSPNRYVDGFSLDGNIRGKNIFRRTDGTNLRILDDNIWEYDGGNSPAWAANGDDCTNAVRARGFEELVAAFRPDVFAVQEYSDKMDAYLGKALVAMGYRMAFEPDDMWNYTPIFYNTKTLKLVESDYLRYIPSKFSNHGSKSYCSSVFILKSTRRRFAVINTHLWWKSEKKQPGSIEARADQVRAIMERADNIVEKYDCPLFVVGDMNCELRTKPMRLFLDAGYVPVWRAASFYGDGRNGHHECNAKGYSRISHRKGGEDDGQAAIDQFFVYNSKSRVDIKVFRRIYAFFTVKLTDHYPNYLDANL